MGKVMRLTAAVFAAVFAASFAGCDDSDSLVDRPPTITLSTGPHHRGDAKVAPGDPGAVLVELAVAGDSSVPVTLRSLAFAFDGSTEVVGTVSLVRDLDGNGLPSEGSDKVLAEPRELSGKSVTFEGLSESVAAQETVPLLLVVSIRPEAEDGLTFVPSVPAPSAVVASAQSDGKDVSVVIAGTPVAGGIKTVASASTLVIAGGPANPAATAIAPAAKNVAMLQFAAKAPGGVGEGVAINAVTITAVGSGDDKAGVENATIYRDVNSNGSVDVGTDTFLASGAYELNNGTVVFTGLSEKIPAGGVANYLVSYDMSGKASGGQTFAVNLADGTAVKAAGAISGRVVAVVGTPLLGANKSISATGGLALAHGVSNPGNTNETAGSEDVPVMQVRLSAAAGQPAKVTELTLRASGSGDDSAGVTAVKLYKDVDANGLLSSSDSLISGPKTFAEDNGTVTFGELDQTIAAESSADWLVVCSFAEDVMPNQNFRVEISANDALVVVDPASDKPLTVTGAPIRGGIKTIQTAGSLTVLAGVSNPGPTNESSGAQAVSMLQFTLAASTAEDVKVTAMTFRASGSGNDATEVLAVKLFRDLDGDGLYTEGTDQEIGTSQKYPADNATVTFSNLTETVQAGKRANYVITYDFAQSILAGRTFAVSITTGAAITAQGMTSKLAIVPGGSAGGSAKTIQTGGSLTVLAGVANPGPTNETPGAKDVSMLQFTLSASTAEAIKVTAVTLRASGSGNDATDVAAVKLYRDVDGDGLLTSGTDVELGSAETFATDNGTVGFTGLAETVAAATRVDFLVTYDFASSVVAGRTFAVAVATGAAITASGVTSGVAIIPGGSAGGPTKTIQAGGGLTVMAGVSNPASTNESPGSKDVSMLQFTLAASTSEDIKVTAVTLRSSGSGNDAADVAAVKLYRDVDGDGMVTPGTDVALGTQQKFSADNGTATFSGLTEVITLGTRVDYLVTYDFADTIVAGRTFAVAVATGAAITASGVASGVKVIPGGSAGGGTKTIQAGGSLTVMTGVANPGATNESPGSTGVPMLQFTLAASTAEDVKVTAIMVRASGTGNDAVDVTGVSLYRDVDGDGQFTPGTDVALDMDARYAADNGTLTFSGLSETVALGTRVDYLVTYDFANSITAGRTFAVSVASGAAITATGATSKLKIIPGGSAGGAGKTIQPGGSLTVMTGVSNPGGTNESAGAEGVPMLQFTLAASTAEDVKVSAVTVRASGSGNDATDVKAVKLYRDVDSDGLFTSGTDVALGSSQVFTVDNGTATFSGLTETIAAGTRVDYVVLYDFSPAVLSGRTFAVSITTGAAVIAKGATSGVSIIPGGSAGGSGKTIQSASLYLATGAYNPVPSNQTPSASGVEMLHARVVSTGSEAVRLESLTLATTGSAHDAYAVEAVHLYKDANGNGKVDAGTDTELGVPTIPQGDNGAVVFAGLNVSIAGGSTLYLLVTYDLSGAASAGQTLQANLSSNSYVVAYGAANGLLASVSGAPLYGGVVTVIQEMNSWKGVAASGAPSPRANHVAVALGSNMFVWGGENSSGVLGDGARYDPTSDKWTSIATTSAPSARTGHVGATASSVAVVWGGYDGSAYRNDGGRYDPGSNTWSAMTTVNAPSARAFATAVSTGAGANGKVIVWGGFDGTNVLNTGAIYDPAGNTWTALPTANAPTGRYFHTAVYTGDCMIVWGGFNGSYLADGARYCISSNNWTTLPASPHTAVANHAAVWTGSEMVVWGGYDGTNYYPWYDGTNLVWRGLGAAYKLSTNSWRSLPVTGAPAGRGQHTAVYSGKHVLVWGGWNGGPLASGGRLDAVFNQWTNISTQAAPVGRYGQSAVWLNGQMIVWGGATASSYLNTGGRYTP